MTKPKRKRLGLPPRWLKCPRLGNIVNDMFLPFKTPLDKKFDSEMSSSNRFSLESLMTTKHSDKIGLIVNLTKTDRYYNAEHLIGEKQFVRIACEGHEGAPTEVQVKQFIEICQNFFIHHEGLYIGVHCTHGFNRTGFMIISYLYEICDVELDTAVQLFASARPPGIYKQDYLDELAKRYDNDVEELKAPLAPNWDEYQDEDESQFPDPVDNLSDNSTLSDDSDNVKNTDLFKPRSHKPAKKVKRNYVAPKNPAFMEGVSGVSVVSDFTVIEEVQQTVRNLMKSEKYDFIGSQPVSMTMENLGLLTKKKYMMSWKADGTRYIMLIADKDLIYMFDRDNCVYKVENINFPKNDIDHHSNTLVDGEMVIDIYEGVKYPRFLIYDVMCINAEYVGDQLFSHRLSIIKTRIIDTRARYVTPNMKSNESFGIRIKDFWPIDKTCDIWEGKFRMQLCHEMDGLIFQPTGLEDVYTPGTCTFILKWKPPELNSIDFLLRWEYVKEKDELPRFVAYLYVTGEKNPFGTIENVKKDIREKYNNKIVECTFDRNTLQWEIMRERTDKSIPNHISTARSVLESIRNPVNIADVYRAISYAKSYNYYYYLLSIIINIVFYSR